MKKQILSEEFKRMQKIAGLINEEETEGKENVEKELKDILKADYPTFVQKLGDNIGDPKFREAIKYIADKNPIKTTDISPKVTDLKPTQNEIDVDKSLKFPLTNAQSAAVYLKGGAISIAGKNIVTGGGGKFIIDGHHRWSQLYCMNPEASITAIDITNITDPIAGLKATQLGIAGDIGQIKTATVQGQNLLKMGKNALVKYVVKTITPEVTEVFKKIIGVDKLSAVSGIKNTNETISQMEFNTLKPLIANYIWKNVEQMQQNNQPVSGAPGRGIMPQTDDATNWPDDAVNPQSIKELQLINILKEGALILTPKERDQIENIIPKIIDLIKGPQIKPNEYKQVDWIYYQFADKTPGSVFVYVGNDKPESNGYFWTNDPKNPNDNVIVIQQNNFSHYFGFISKAQKFLAGDEDVGIEYLRQTLKHELIHAKDPAMNQHYLKEPYDPNKIEVYYKSWAEFQTMTGQFLESIIAGVDRLLATDFSDKEAKKVETALSEILNFFAGKSKNLSQDTFDFIQNTKSRNFFQRLIKNIENFTGIHPTGNSLSIYLAYISAIKRYHPSAYNEFLKDLYKTIDQAKDKLKTTSINITENKKFLRMQKIAGLKK
jgi:hypothetical protein